jgi:iron complex transport system ATP-binding protein
MTRLDPSDAALEARDVSFSYASPVVTDFCLSLGAGTITGIIGPNGSGKTTVLRLLDGILRPASGQVLLNGNLPLRHLTRRQIARHIAMVSQNGPASSFHTVFEFAMQGRSPHLSLLGFETIEDEQVARQALEMTRLGDYLDARVSEISGGEKQRLLLARALTQQPEILLLDEFTANLDINYQVELMRLVRRLTRERRLATAVVSHEINLLAAFSDRIVLMKNGRIRHQGNITEVVTRENLRKLFGLDFLVRPLPSGIPEVLPIMDESRQ